jgi:hypothetical protein
MRTPFGPFGGDTKEEPYETPEDIGMVAGKYEKDPELDLARVGDDTSVPNREIL